MESQKLFLTRTYCKNRFKREPEDLSLEEVIASLNKKTPTGLILDTSSVKYVNGLRCWEAVYKEKKNDNS